jgi:hypothetical protein
MISRLRSKLGYKLTVVKFLADIWRISGGYLRLARRDRVRPVCEPLARFIWTGIGAGPIGIGAYRSTGAVRSSARR